MAEHTQESTPTAGRPRTFADEDFYNAAARVLTKFGYHGLTLEAVALEAGSSRPALNRRFGDKQGLIRAFVSWIVEQVDFKFEVLEDSLQSPLEILKAGSFAFSTGLPSSGVPNQDQTMASFDPSNQLRFFINAWTEPQLRPLMTDMAHSFERSVARYIRAAIDCGELIQCDADELAYLLSASGIGSLLHNVDDPEVDLSSLHERVFDAILRPYIISRTQPT